MADPNTTRNWRLWAMVAVLAVIGVPLLLVFIVLGVLSTGVADHYIRDQIISQINKRLTGRAELGQFHFDPWGLHVALVDFTIHGRNRSERLFSFTPIALM